MRTRMLVLAVAVSGACAGAASPDDGSPAPLSGIAPVGDTSGEGTSDASSEDGESTSAAQGDGADIATSSTGGTDSGATDETTGDSAMDGAVGGICAESPADSPCTACTKASCCTQLMACSSDPGCMCFMTCVASSADVFGCGTQCAVDLFAAGPVGDLVSCSSGPCAAACL